MRPALINMGSVLTANNTVETDPASTATVAMWRRYEVQVLPRVGSVTHLAEASDG